MSQLPSDRGRRRGRVALGIRLLARAASRPARPLGVVLCRPPTGERCGAVASLVSGDSAGRPNALHDCDSHRRLVPDFAKNPGDGRKWLRCGTLAPRPQFWKENAMWRIGPAWCTSHRRAHRVEYCCGIKKCSDVQVKRICALSGYPCPRRSGLWGGLDFTCFVRGVRVSGA